MSITTLAIDLATSTIQLHGTDKKGRAVLKKKVTRKQLMELTVQMPKCRMVMESCATSHFWGRKFKEQGHEVSLIAAQFVKPFVKSQKNDRNDAEAIFEASQRPTMRYVAVKSVGQQAILSVHRVRQRLMSARTSILNQTRGLLLEFGIVFPKQVSNFKKGIPLVLENAENELPDLVRELVQQNVEELLVLEKKIKFCDEKLEQFVAQNEDCKRILKVPGVGILGATAFVSAIGNPRLFKNGRQVSAWLGVVPRQHSTGGVPKLLSITKRGDPHLRSLLIHGARATLVAMGRKKNKDPLTERTLAMLEKKGWNKTSVALANRMCRIMWHLWAHQEEYKKIA